MVLPPESMGAVVSRPPSPSPPLEDLSDALWQVRHLLDVLRFRLEEERGLALAGGSSWVASAHRAVEQAVERFRVTELVRAMATEAVARDLAVASSPTLEQLAAAAPPPWGDILTAHREALVKSVRSLSDLADANERLAASSPGGAAPHPTRLGLSLTEFIADTP